MVKAARLGAVLTLLCVLFGCGEDTLFDVSEAQNNSYNSDAGSEESTPDNPQSSSGTASALISWHIPTARENGENLSLNDIGGYEILYRKSDEIVFNSVRVSDQSQSERVIEGLTPGRYEFFVVAFDEEGLYSDFSEAAIAEIDLVHI